MPNRPGIKFKVFGRVGDRVRSLLYFDIIDYKSVQICKLELHRIVEMTDNIASNSAL